MWHVFSQCMKSYYSVRRCLHLGEMSEECSGSCVFPYWPGEIVWKLSFLQDSSENSKFSIWQIPKNISGLAELAYSETETMIIAWLKGTLAGWLFAACSSLGIPDEGQALLTLVYPSSFTLHLEQICIPLNVCLPMFAHTSVSLGRV